MFSVVVYLYIVVYSVIIVGHRVMKKSVSANYHYVFVLVLQELTSRAGPNCYLFGTTNNNVVIVEFWLNFAIIQSVGHQTTHFTRTFI